MHAPQPSRRDLLHLGSVGLAGLSLPTLLAAETKRSRALHAKADACIIIHLNGGPSHLDMWDMKPDAPAEVRGEFQSVPSTLPGLRVSEHLPQLARQVHQATLVRSMHHSVNNAHAAAVYVSMTGHDRGEIGGGARPSDRPSPGCVAAMLRPTPRGAVPYVALPYWTREGASGPPQPGFFAGLMGRAYDPLWVLNDPSRSDFSVPEFTLTSDVTVDRLAARGQLLANINARVADRRAKSELGAMNQFQQQATDILTSARTQSAFRIDREPGTLRQAYGMNIYGQSVLLARRLIEAGTRIVTVSWAPDANATWDTHTGNFKKLKNPLLPQFDAACSNLVADLEQRGMLERTIVAVLGDFGRTPKINKNDAGRDHWNFCYSLMMFGGGFQRGLVYGASDKIGAFPNDLPLIPGDIISTLYQLLGIDPQHELYDLLGRPHQVVPRGRAVPDLIT